MVCTYSRDNKIVSYKEHMENNGGPSKRKKSFQLCVYTTLCSNRPSSNFQVMSASVSFFLSYSVTCPSDNNDEIVNQRSTGEGERQNK